MREPRSRGVTAWCYSSSIAAAVAWPWLAVASPGGASLVVLQGPAHVEATGPAVGGTMRVAYAVRNVHGGPVKISVLAKSCTCAADVVDRPVLEGGDIGRVSLNVAVGAASELEGWAVIGATSKGLASQLVRVTFKARPSYSTGLRCAPRVLLIGPDRADAEWEHDVDLVAVIVETAEPSHGELQAGVAIQEAGVAVVRQPEWRRGGAAGEWVGRVRLRIDPARLRSAVVQVALTLRSERGSRDEQCAITVDTRGGS